MAPCLTSCQRALAAHLLSCHRYCPGHCWNGLQWVPALFVVQGIPYPCVPCRHQPQPLIPDCQEQERMFQHGWVHFSPYLCNLSTVHYTPHQKTSIAAVWPETQERRGRTTRLGCYKFQNEISLDLPLGTDTPLESCAPHKSSQHSTDITHSASFQKYSPGQYDMGSQEPPLPL